jgi:hypothetical protein
MTGGDVELTHRQRELLIRFLGVMILALIVLFVTVCLASYQARLEIVKTQRVGCERGKKDRAANAAAWTAHSVYITKVTAAKSVQEDVKRAARIASRTYVGVSADLRRRAALSCKTAYPDPPFLKVFGAT